MSEAQKLDAYLRLLNEASVAWVAVCKDGHVPDAARVAGIDPAADLSSVTFYVGEAMGRSVLDTLAIHPALSLLTVSMHTFESYQYKGVCESIRQCTPEEEALQRTCLDRFTAILRSIGISPTETEKISKLYYQQPSFAVTFRVQQIFTQAPRQGAGSLVLHLER